MSEPHSPTHPQRKDEHFTCPHLGGVELHAAHWGDLDAGRTLVLLHGGGAGAHWWEHLAPRLAPGRHVVALDFRGHGASGHPAEVKAGAFREDLLGLLEHLERPEATLVGHSMGAHVAAEHAAAHSETSGLVLMEPSRGASRRRRRAARLALIMRRTYPTREQAVARFRFLPAAAHAAEPLRHSIAERSVRQEPDGRWAFNFDPRWFSVAGGRRVDFSSIACPTLVLRGTESPLLTAEGARELAAEITGAQLLEIPAAGHHIQVDQPSAVESALLSFLSQHGL